jgi:hypothetical protein
MAGPFGGVLALECGCCDCPQSFCVTVRCPGGPKLAGVDVEVREAADPVGSGAIVGSATTNAFGAACVTIADAGDYDVVLAKGGYHGVESGPHAATCESGASVPLEMCPESFELTVRVRGCGVTVDGGCPVPGATVTLSGDATDSGTTDADGLVTFDVPVPDENCTPVELTITSTAPAGSGLADASTDVAFNPCADRTASLTHAGASGCLCACSCYPAMPSSLSYSDPFGSTTIGHGLAPFGLPFSGETGWYGTFDYTSDEAIRTSDDCGPYTTRCLWPKTGTVTVHVFLSCSGGDCDAQTFRLRRYIRAGVGNDGCSGPPVIAPRASESIGGLCFPTFAAPQESRGLASRSCDGTTVVALSIAFANTGFVPPGYTLAGDWSGTATITGSC